MSLEALSQRILFLDRDGVINVDSGHPWRVSDIRFCDGIFDLVRRANNANLKVVVVTNQAGIAKGMYTEEDFHVLTDWMKQQFRLADARIDDVKFCPHHPEGVIERYRTQCLCRKPLPGMIEQGIRQFNGDHQNSILVGDRATDIEAAVASKIGCAYRFSDDSKSPAPYIKQYTRIIEIRSLSEIIF